MKFRFRFSIFITLCFTAWLIFYYVSTRYTIIIRINSGSNTLLLCRDKSQKNHSHQKVVSFSLFVKEGHGEAEKVSKRYMLGIKENFKQIKSLYPGWNMRVYTNINLTEPIMKANVDDIQNETMVFVCKNISFSFQGRELRKVDGMLWRSLPILDPTVDIFIVRDLDSAVNKRERSAVKQWEESDKIFHAMRDHPYHDKSVMGGLWGGKNYMMDNHTKLTLKHQIFNKVYTPGWNDQDILNYALYVPFQEFFMMHDSYYCETWRKSIPFPEQRTDIKHFVGGTYLNSTVQTNVRVCPVTCRPFYGKNWTYC